MIVNKPYTNAQYADLAVYCNENNCHIEDKGEYLESVENPPYVPTYEEVDKMREDYRKEHIDSKTAMRSRKMANGTWTEEDEQAYLQLDAEVTAWIEENLPYPVGDNNVI
jgi:hypothetical protein